MSEVIGDLRIIQGKKEVEWEIADFFFLLTEMDETVLSPTFRFRGERFHLELYPNSVHRELQTNDRRKRFKPVQEDHIGLFVMKETSDPPLCLSYSFHLKTESGALRELHSNTSVFGTGKRGWGKCPAIGKSELLRRKDELAPSDVLTIICSLEHADPYIVRRLEKLSQDFQLLMRDTRSGNFIVRVAGETFQLQRNILRARVPVLSALIEQVTEEIEPSFAIIPNCQAATFRSFLEYVYTGTVTLSQESVFDLHHLAARYGVVELRDDCVRCIRNTLSIDTFFEGIALAIRYDQRELMDAATLFLSQNMVAIMLMRKWQDFLADNPELANKMCVEALLRKSKTKSVLGETL